jgi:osmotically-inducible protein OsmY
VQFFGRAPIKGTNPGTRPHRGGTPGPNPREHAMKKIIICLLLGVILGALGWNYYQNTRNPMVARRTEDLADRARDKAAGVKDAVAERSRAVGGRIDDDRIIAVIKTKLLMDKDLSALAISVECTEGNVVLTGSAASPDLIMRAVELARQTKGVRDVASKLQVKN